MPGAEQSRGYKTPTSKPVPDTEFWNWRHKLPLKVRVHSRVGHWRICWKSLRAADLFHLPPFFTLRQLPLPDCGGEIEVSFLGTPDKAESHAEFYAESNILDRGIPRSNVPKLQITKCMDISTHPLLSLFSWVCIFNTSSQAEINKR